MKSVLRFSVLCCLALTLLFCQVSFAQSPTLKTTVDKKNILIGEQFNYQVEASFPTNTYKLHWLNIPDSIKHFDVVERGKVDSSESNGTLNIRQSIILTSFDSGLNTIPQFFVNFDSLKDDTTLNLRTDSLQINVTYAPLDSTKNFHDIKSIIEVKNELPWWFWIVIIVGALLLIGLVIFVILYFRKNKKPQSVFKSKLTPYDEAMQSLTELKKMQLQTREEIKQYHVRLAEIFKRYISRKMNLNLLNLTSNELLLKLAENNISKEDISSVAGTTRMADAVKFAKYIPPAYESEQSFDSIKKAIENINNQQLNQPINK